MPELQEVEALIEPDRGTPVPKEAIETAIQALLFHQVIYEDTRAIGKTYDLLRRHRGFFERYFAAMGHRLVFEQREALIALLPGEGAYAWRERRLSKDETLVLLALRMLLENGFKAGQMSETGRVDSTTDELHDVIRTLAGTEPPNEGRLIEILREFRRRGLVRIGDRDMVERVTPIVVLPGVRLLCTDAFARAVAAWVAAGAEERGDADLFDFAAAYQNPATSEVDDADEAPA
jgi:hypothetical protein